MRAPRARSRIYGYAAIAVALASTGVLAGTRPDQARAATPPTHTLAVSGAGVGMFPAFAQGTERFAVTTTSATAGTVTVTASTSDPSGTVLVDGRPEPDGTATVDGLVEGDEISVIFSDSGGTRVHSLVYLPAEFPQIELVTRKAGLAPGYVALTLTRWSQDPHAEFETAVDRNGVPVYVTGENAGSLDLKQAANGHYTVGRPTTTPDRTGYRIVELDDHFRPLAAYETALMTNTDGHDSIVRPDGSRILLGYEPNAGTGRLDAVIQEQAPDGQVVYTWNSGDVPGEDLHAETVADPSAADYAHINSVWLTADGNLLASFRHLSAVLKIDWRTDDGDGRGGIIWKLGGRDSDFTFVDDPYPGGPCAQHTASELPNGHILVFDNGSASMFGSLCVDPADRGGPTIDRPFTRVTEYALDEGAGTATLVRDVAPAARFGFFAGSASRLANGNTLIGWAASRDAVATEVGPTGEVLWEIRTPPVDPTNPNDFYSTYRAALMQVPDAQAPSVTLDAPAEGATYPWAARVTADFGCTDRGGSSLRQCTGTADRQVDTTVPGEHTYTVTARDGAGNLTTVTHHYTVAPAARHPDVSIRLVGSGGWVGDGVYGTVAEQQVAAQLRRGGTVTVAVRVQNDGRRDSAFRISAATGSKRFSVRYLAAGVDVTSGVGAGRFRTAVLAPGEQAVLRAVVTRTGRARAGDAKWFRVRAVPAGAVAPTDSVALVVTAQ
ncbi:MAG TPA: aryl-sulfate sulfotransferase [Nocardioides sp.]|uniref:aryl-sulfate sulfotransferase n=1 Tax=Nocardioides sp. TaxID=35761 RepID=UPI002CA9CF89|nr:aryl-sulfate sulfotransferase [Nocardioides sp.]HQR26710.1 aryl-sulfate sulfotransferase [Nocardioides sp.]